MPGATNTLGGYQIIREIARSNDIVYEARDPALNRRIAVKELALAPNIMGQEKRERIERFYREARAAGALSHPNIVTIFKVGEDNGRHFIAMEYLEGDTLRNQLQVGGPLPVHRALEICAQVCDALDYAHQRGIVHRDVKPDNIQILPDGTAKLTDFGIARLGSEPGITQAGQVFGTPSYMSPEQIAGKPVDQRSDIFSLGVVLYEVLTARKPFTGDSIVTITYNIMNLEPAPPPGVPPHLQGIVRKAMAKSPDARYASALDFARELRSPPPAAPAFGNSPFSQGPQSLPRVTSLPGPGAPGSLPVIGGAPASNRPMPGPQTGPYGYPAQLPLPAIGGAPSPPALPTVPGPAAIGAPPGIAALPPPSSAFRNGARDVVVKNGPFLTLLGLVAVFILIALGVFWALKSGYEGYQNGEINDDQRATNNRAAQFLQQGDYQDAYPILVSLNQQVNPASPLNKAVRHNTGTYWLEAARAEQQRGNLQAARDDYSQALPLLPERQTEIQQAIESMQMSLSAPGGSPPPAAATVQPEPVQVDRSGAPTAPSAGYPAPAGAPAAAPAAAQAPPAASSVPNASSVSSVAARTPTPKAPDAHSAEREQSQSEYESGRTAQSRGDLVGARSHFTQSLKLDPGAPWASDAVSRVFSLSDQIDKGNSGG